MAAEVMITDVIEIDSFGDPRHLVDIAQEAIQIQVIADAVLITLEVVGGSVPPPARHRPLGVVGTAVLNPVYRLAYYHRL